MRRETVWKWLASLLASVCLVLAIGLVEADLPAMTRILLCTLNFSAALFGYKLVASV